MVDRSRNTENNVSPKSLRSHRLVRSLVVGVLVLVQFWGGVSVASAATPITFTGEELLGKPTDTSITINIIPDSDIEYFYEYGTSSGSYSDQTAYYSANGGEPHEVVINGLVSNTLYYYRMQYNYGGTGWIVRPEYSFHTQRDEGEAFVFTILTDSHAMYNAQYQQASQLIINDQPDFHFDLGDTFMTDGMGNQNAVNNAYLAQRDLLYIGGIGQSAPIFLASGNHENEEGWNLDDTFSIALASIQARKAYYPTPTEEGEFYTGNTDPLAAINDAVYGDDLREDYYAWDWGDVLFVVIDPFQYTMTNPYGSMAGEGSDDPASGDRWNWTLGQQQFNWLKDVLQTSNAKYKFIFAHHMVGGTQSYVRGGAVPAHLFEWGGYEADGVTWGFDTKRVGWGDEAIHQLFIDNNVNAFFHGHDHQYAYEVRDGIVYQSLPRPSTGLDFNYYSESDQYTERVLASPGYLRVSVSPTITAVEYVDSSNASGTVKHSYTIEPNETTPDVDVLGDVNGDNLVNSTDVLIILSGDAGISSPHCPMNCGDANGDGEVNTTDALIILTYNASISVPFPVGEEGCPVSVNPCLGCTP